MGWWQKIQPQTRSSVEPGQTMSPPSVEDRAGTDVGSLKSPRQFSLEERASLLALARGTLERVTLRENPLLPESLSPRLNEPRACFVTLRINGKLRGCIGNISPRSSLAQAVVDNTCGAALRDCRFAPLEADEVPQTRIEISVLTEPVPLEESTPELRTARLRPGLDGVILKIGPHQATFLPKVWDQLPEPEVFLAQLSRKAGCEAHAWKSPIATLSVYQAETFAEP